MFRIFFIFLLPIFFLFTSFTPTSAADTLVFDSTDHYLGACQLTDKSAWTLTQDLQVTTFQVWYSWNQNESSLPVEIYKDGVLFAEFNAQRSSCDPYQKQWCNADFLINKLFPKGRYTTQIPDARQCLKPGGTGAIRLYSPETASSSPTAQPTSLPATPTLAPAPITTITNPSSAKCSCNSTVVIAASAGISSLLSLGISLLIRKKVSP